jgi:hypothetical protein
VGAVTAKSEREISAAGIEFGDAAHQTMIFLFQGNWIKLLLLSRTLKPVAELKSLTWKCVGCGA